MQRQGTIIHFHESRGFGFIHSPGGQVYFHRRDFHHPAGTPPVPGLAVVFDEIHVGGKGPRGMAVQPVGLGRSAANDAPRDGQRQRPPARRAAARTAPRRGTHATPVLLLMLVWLGLLAWAVSAKRLPVALLPALVLLNGGCLAAYWRDKTAALRGTRRIREDSLHVLSLLGGWPAAWLAQQVLRHKSSKAAFQSTYWSAVALHWAALLGWVFWVAPQRWG